MAVVKTQEWCKRCSELCGALCKGWFKLEATGFALQLWRGHCCLTIRWSYCMRVVNSPLGRCPSDWLVSVLALEMQFYWHTRTQWIFCLGLLQYGGCIGCIWYRMYRMGACQTNVMILLFSCSLCVGSTILAPRTLLSVGCRSCQGVCRSRVGHGTGWPGSRCWTSYCHTFADENEESVIRISAAAARSDSVSVWVADEPVPSNHKDGVKWDTLATSKLLSL